MRRASFFYYGGAVAMAVAGYLFIARTSLQAQQSSTLKVGGNDIGGVVISNNGPEAGVWVIAETTDLPTRYIKEVVTDDSGRYLIPDLPKARYTVWARGYGLVDTPKVQCERGFRACWSPGSTVDLKPNLAPDKKAASQYYP